MSLADWMNDIDGGYAERERMASWGGHEDNCGCPECEQEREEDYDTASSSLHDLGCNCQDCEQEREVNDEYQQYLKDPNTQEEE